MSEDPEREFKWDHDKLYRRCVVRPDRDIARPVENYLYVWVAQVHQRVRIITRGRVWRRFSPW